MYRQLLVVCLFLAIAADLLEAKNSLHKRSQNHRQGRQPGEPEPPGSREVFLCSVAYKSSCPEPEYIRQYKALSDAEKTQRFTTTDLSVMCTAANQVRDCHMAVIGNDTNCQQAERLFQVFRPLKQFALRALSFVCEERFNVINANKGCLVRENDRNQPALLGNIFALCPQPFLAFIVPVESGSVTTVGPESPICITPEFQDCVRNATTTTCGQDLGTVANDLISISREEFCAAPTSTSSIKKRYAGDFALLEKLLKSFL